MKWASIGIGVGLLMAIGLESTPSAARWRKPQLDELLGESTVVATVIAEMVDNTAYDASTDLAYTWVLLDVVETFWGAPENEFFEFLLPGGERPDDTEDTYLDIPQFTEGGTYLVFVRGGSWHVTPFTRGTEGVFRLVDHGNKPFWVDDGGRGVTSLGPPGFGIGGPVEPSEHAFGLMRQGLQTPEEAYEPLLKDRPANVRAAANAMSVLGALRKEIASVRMTTLPQVVNTLPIYTVPDPIFDTEAKP